MSKRLSADDRHAVDLVLERPDGQGDRPLVEMVFARPVKAKFENRLDAVEQVLSLLDNMPAEEPSVDLIRRTMQRIEEARVSPTASHLPRTKTSRTSSRHA